MKRVIIRSDLMKKKEYSEKYGIDRVKLDKKIEDGEFVVEQISGTDYIRLKTK